jgi:hypothetical protein
LKSHIHSTKTKPTIIAQPKWSLKLEQQQFGQYHLKMPVISPKRDWAKYQLKTSIQSGVNSMKVYNYKSNQTVVETKEYTALLSYGVPQVIVCKEGHLLGGDTVLVNSKRYSNTTSKHRNAYLQTLNLDNYTVIPAFPEEIQEVTGLETR